MIYYLFAKFPDEISKKGVFGRTTLSVLEYGIAVFAPRIDKSLAKMLAARVDIMINRHLRMILGLPIYLPVKDMRALFQYDPFYLRWEELRARFYNHLSSEANTPDLIQYQHPSTWKFALPDSLEKLMVKGKTMRSFLYRLFPKLDADSICTSCQQHQPK